MATLKIFTPMVMGIKVSVQKMCMYHSKDKGAVYITQYKTWLNSG